ncbi:hypothetical protein IF1G_08905 [Cordyceps javanica]|uniref:Uncharacterized protein n=1 Tax=Cordyceps javanica TaxID=43265 RepID=A0A545USD8_9HYPO|nr:hypothetical protein IF1G_08905 [Cordyceps javanica]
MHRSLYRNPTPTGALSASSTTRLARYVDCPTTPHHPARDIHHISSLNSHIHRLPSRAAASALISFRLSHFGVYLPAISIMAPEAKGIH